MIRLPGHAGTLLRQNGLGNMRFSGAGERAAEEDSAPDVFLRGLVLILSLAAPEFLAALGERAARNVSSSALVMTYSVSRGWFSWAASSACSRSAQIAGAS